MAVIVPTKRKGSLSGRPSALLVRNLPASSRAGPFPYVAFHGLPPTEPASKVGPHGDDPFVLSIGFYSHRGLGPGGGGPRTASWGGRLHETRTRLLAQVKLQLVAVSVVQGRCGVDNGAAESAT
jgi:hypothetical protein